MSELQAIYEEFRTGNWACSDANECPCRGSGWALSDVDTWHECPIHFSGQTHPEYEGCECDPCDVAPAPKAEPAPSAPAPEAVEDDNIPF